MSCDAIRDCLVDYYYRDLSHERRREIGLHLGSCAACALEYCRLEGDLSGLRDYLEGEEPRLEIKAKLADRVRTEFRATLWERIEHILRLPLPAYQVALFASAVALVFALILGGRPIAPLASRAPSSSSSSNQTSAFSIVSVTVIDHVDASTMVKVDPNVL
jgi:hypothetical protein